MNRTYVFFLNYACCILLILCACGSKTSSKQVESTTTIDTSINAVSNVSLASQEITVEFEPLFLADSTDVRLFIESVQNACEKKDKEKIVQSFCYPLLQKEKYNGYGVYNNEAFSEDDMRRYLNDHSNFENFRKQFDYQSWKKDLSFVLYYGAGVDGLGGDMLLLDRCYFNSWNTSVELQEQVEITRSLKEMKTDFAKYVNTAACGYYKLNDFLIQKVNHQLKIGTMLDLLNSDSLSGKAYAQSTILYLNPANITRTCAGLSAKDTPEAEKLFSKFQKALEQNDTTAIISCINFPVLFDDARMSKPFLNVEELKQQVSTLQSIYTKNKFKLDIEKIASSNNLQRAYLFHYETAVKNYKDRVKKINMSGLLFGEVVAKHEEKQGDKYSGVVDRYSAHIVSINGELKIYKFQNLSWEYENK